MVDDNKTMMKILNELVKFNIINISLLYIYMDLSENVGDIHIV